MVGFVIEQHSVTFFLSLCISLESKATTCTVTVGNDTLPNMTPEMQLQVLIYFFLI